MNPTDVTDPWGIGTVSGTRMEVLVRLRREMPSDCMGGDYLRLRRYTISKSEETIWNATGDDMERGTSP